MIRWVAALVLVVPFAGYAQDEAATGAGAILRALDKVSGQTTELVLRSGETGGTFRLEIDLIECRYPTENLAGDAYAYLVIRDKGGGRDIAFEGWMIASSPALNAMDHARYDVWVLRCITA